MTPADLQAAQRELGWTDADLAVFLRLGAKGDRTVRRWRTDAARRGVPGPVQVAVELKLAAVRRQKPDAGAPTSPAWQRPTSP